MTDPCGIKKGAPLCKADQYAQRIKELEKRLNDKRLLVNSSHARAAEAFDRIKELEAKNDALNWKNHDIGRQKLELQAQVERLASLSQRVMDMLEEHGSGIVPHLLDDDENAGQRLRDELAVINGLEAINGDDDGQISN